MTPDPLSSLVQRALYFVLESDQPNWDEKLGELDTRIRFLAEHVCDQSNRDLESKKQTTQALSALESKNASLESSLSAAMTLMVDAHRALEREVVKRKNLGQNLARIEQRVAEALKD